MSLPFFSADDVTSAVSMQEAIDALADYNAINDAFGLPENYEDADKMDKLMKEQGVLQDKIESLVNLVQSKHEKKGCKET